VDSPRFRFTTSRIVDSTHRFVSEAVDAGVIMNHAGSYDGTTVEVDGQPMLNFGSCSYLGLEVRDDLKDGACEAARRYGTQLPFSRAYLENRLYRELEEQLTTMTGGHVLVAPSTTLAHIAALPVLVRERDAVLIDQFAHASLHTATTLLREIPVERVRHNRLDVLERRVAELTAGGRRVFYVCDGLYSMRGDLAPFARLRALLDAYPTLHLYIDDAHSTSWSGARGRGAALDSLVGHPRVIVALSLNKAFSAAGGCLVLPDLDTVRLVRRCGGPMLFSGPIQPPMLGAAVASARLHNDPSFAALQAELAALIDHAWQAVGRHAIPLAGRDRTPIFMVPCDSPAIVFRTVSRLRERGFYVCPSVFPAVPVNQPGIRFTITRHNDPAAIDAFIAALGEALAEELGAALSDERTPGPVENSAA
jgi:7-keto-8-aminopelargonate synthetase-like enzyme